MLFDRAASQRIKEQEVIIEKARSYIQRMQDAKQHQQDLIDNWSGKQFILSHLEGEWEIPVRWADAPTGTRAVATLQPIKSEHGQADALTVFALQSAFSDRARLEELGKSGWALVRAWPLNLPGGPESIPGSSNDRYVLCALTSMNLWEAGQDSNHMPARKDSSRPGGLEIRA